MNKYIKHYFIGFFIFAFSLSINASEYLKNNEQKLEECVAHVRTFRIFLDNNVAPIVKMSDENILNVPEMINEQIVYKLDDYFKIFSACSIEQAGNIGSSFPRFNIIERELFSMLMFMRNIQESSSSMPEMIALLSKYMNKNYNELNLELGKQ